MSDERETDGAGADPRRDAAPERVSRRQALRVLGVVPLAGAALVQPPTPQQPRQPHTTPNQPATQTRPAQPARNAPRRQFFTAREWRLAGVLADDVIPRDERSGSATEAGVVEFIDFHMSVPETTPETRVAMRGGLRWLDTECRRRHGVAYDRATPAQRHAILDDIAGPAADVRPAMRPGAAFFARFRDLVGAGFFSSAMGWKDLQYMGNVFLPRWDGCPEPALAKLGVSHALMDTRVPSQVPRPEPG